MRTLKIMLHPSPLLAKKNMGSTRAKYVATFVLTCYDYQWPNSDMHINRILTMIVENDLESSYQHAQQVVRDNTERSTTMDDYLVRRDNHQEARLVTQLLKKTKKNTPNLEEGHFGSNFRGAERGRGDRNVPDMQTEVNATATKAEQVNENCARPNITAAATRDKWGSPARLSRHSTKVEGQNKEKTNHSRALRLKSSGV